MFHPLIGSLRKIKDSEIEERILDLTKKYNIAMRLGQGSIAEQIIVTLNTYREELSARQRASLEATMSKKNKDLDDLINVD
jgi:hypothetical protein